MIRIGITGQSGFVGSNLYNKLCLYPEKYDVIPFEDCFFENEKLMCSFVKRCDVIVHLAAMMRSSMPNEVYKTNMRLTDLLINAMEIEGVSPTILFSSSVQEGNGSEYGRSKEMSRIKLGNWAEEHNSAFIGMLFPNLFGPLAKPNSHSFIATFCYKLTHNSNPEILIDNTVPLRFIDTLLEEILQILNIVHKHKAICKYKFRPNYYVKVSDVLLILNQLHSGKEANTLLEHQLKITLDSYKDYEFIE